MPISQVQRTVLLKSVDDNIKKMYSELKAAILNLGKDIETRPRKHYMLFMISRILCHFIFSGQSLSYILI